MTHTLPDSIPRPDGSTLSLSVQGPADAPPLVLSNSLATDRGMWARVLPALSTHYRVISYDTRGHGQSRSATHNASLADLADDLLAVMDAAQAPKAWVAGVSLGGMTGLTLALRHPQRLLGLMACHCRDTMSPELNTAWDQRIALVHQQGVGALVEPTLERWFTADFRSAEPALMDEVRGMIGRTTPAGYEACVRAIQGLALQDALSTLSVRTLYVAGAQDGAAPADVMRAMAARTPGARCEVLDPCGHISPLQQTERFIALVRQFCTPA